MRLDCLGVKIPSQATGEFNKLWEPSADASNELLGEVGVKSSLDHGMVGFSMALSKHRGITVAKSTAPF